MPGHELDVARARLGLRRCDAFDGVERQDPHADLARERLGQPRADQGLEEDRLDLALPGQPDDGGQRGRARLGLRGESHHRHLLESIAARQVAECRMRHHDLAPRAVAEPRLEAQVERVEPGAEGAGVVGVGGFAGRDRSARARRGSPRPRPGPARDRARHGDPRRRSRRRARPSVPRSRQPPRSTGLAASLISFSAHGSKPAPLYTKTRARCTWATSCGEGSQSCPWTPGGTSEITCARSPATCRANSYIG